MHSSTYIALFTGAAAAQQSATILNLFQFQDTLTVLGATGGATTYQNSCPSSAAGISAIPSDRRPGPDSPTGTLLLTPATPTPTAKARLRRQTASAADSDSDDYDFCEPYTLIQGPSTYQFHLTDPVPGAWTVDMNCAWQGAITAADLTCTVTQSGYVPEPSARVVTTSVLKQSEILDMEAYQTVALVSVSSASSGRDLGSASRTASGSGAAAAATQSTGLAPGGPLATGAAMFYGAAAGMLAAALVL